MCTCMYLHVFRFLSECTCVYLQVVRYLSVHMCVFAGVQVFIWMHMNLEATGPHQVPPLLLSILFPKTRSFTELGLADLAELAGLWNPGVFLRIAGTYHSTSYLCSCWESALGSSLTETLTQPLSWIGLHFWNFVFFYILFCYFLFAFEPRELVTSE